MTPADVLESGARQHPRTQARSFWRHFVVFFLVALVPLVFTVFAQRAIAPPAPQTEAERVAHEVDRLLQLRLNETFTIAALPSLRAFAASDPASRAQRATVALNEIQAWLAADPPVREVFVLDRQGATLLTTGKAWNPNWSTRAFIRQALAGNLDVSAPSRDLGEFSQYYASPVLDNRGEVAGALVARIAAQELWGSVGATENGYAILSDENGVRLADGGDPARNLVAWAPLTTEQQARVIGEQTYGAQVTVVRASNFTRAAQAFSSGALDLLAAGDIGAANLSAQHLKTKPWTVVVVSSAPPPGQTVLTLTVGSVIAIAGAALGAFWLSR